MAEMKARVDIVGSDKTQRAFRSVRKNVTGFNSELKRTALTFATAFGVKQLIDMGDSITDLRNRLNSFNNDAEKTAKQMDLIAQVAAHTRSSFEATGVVFTRMIQATQHLGITTEELAAATATVNATFKLSGTTAYEAANSARQLAQGLSSGRLSGDEMRSVLENNVVLANLLADGFGATVGQLRIMGAAGKITTEKIMPILINSFEETTTKVSDMQFTIDAAFQVLQVRLYEAVKAFNEITGVQDAVANSIAYVARNINELTVIGLGALIPAIGMATTAVFGLLGSMVALVVANPITAFFSAFGVALGYTLTTSQEFQRQMYNLFGELFQQNLPNFFHDAEIAVRELGILFAEERIKIHVLAQGIVDAIYAGENAIRGLLGMPKSGIPQLSPIDIEAEKEKLEQLKGIVKKEFKEIAEGEPLPVFEEGGFLEGLSPEAIYKSIQESMKIVDDFQDDLSKKFADFISKQKTLGEEVGDILTKSFNNLADVIADFVTGSKFKIKDLINTITRDLIGAMIRAQITNPMAEAFGMFLTGGEEGKKQGGGQVLAGTPYIVGEKGAELFIPSVSGKIVPNHQLQGGGSVVINQSVNFATGVQDTVKNEVLQLLPEIAETSKGAVLEAMNRGGNFRRGMR